MAHIGDVNAHTIVVSVRFDADGIVEVKGGLAVDGHDVLVGEIAASLDQRNLIGDRGELVGFQGHLVGKAGGYPEAHEIDVFILMPDTDFYQELKDDSKKQ